MPGSDSDTVDADISEVLRALDTLVPSAEPAVVFTSLVRVCVPLICGAATVTITSADDVAYAITWPRDTYQERQPSGTNNVSAAISASPIEEHGGYFGALTLHFDSPSSRYHEVLARLIVDRATTVVDRERLVDSVIAARARVAGLERILLTQQGIG